MNQQPRIVIASESTIKIRSIQDVPDVLGAVFGADGFLLTENELSPEFFDLSTGIAGEIFQKFTNYQIRAGIVLENPNGYGERFSELVFEHQNHKLIRFFDSIEAAKTWLENA
jgi:hypothetical protein